MCSSPIKFWLCFVVASKYDKSIEWFVYVYIFRVSIEFFCVWLFCALFEWDSCRSFFIEFYYAFACKSHKIVYWIVEARPLDMAASTHIHTDIEDEFKRRESKQHIIECKTHQTLAVYAHCNSNSSTQQTQCNLLLWNAYVGSAFQFNVRFV